MRLEKLDNKEHISALDAAQSELKRAHEKAADMTRHFAAQRELAEQQARPARPGHSGSWGDLRDPEEICEIPRRSARS